MEPVNGRIIVGVIILTAAGSYRYFFKNPATATGGRSITLTRVIVGGFILAVLASILDLAGGQVSQVVGLIVWLAVATAIIALLESSNLLGKIQLFLQPEVKRPPAKA